MPSNYEQFYVMRTNENGVVEPVAGVTVVIYDVASETDLGSVATDPNGLVAAGSVAVDPGSRIRFRVQNHHGLAGSVTQITT